MGVVGSFAREAAPAPAKPERLAAITRLRAVLIGWVVVYLERIERDELAELTYEAWSLSAPAALVEAAAGRLPT